MNKNNLKIKIPKKNVKEYILLIADKYNILYLYNQLDFFADTISSLSDNNIEKDNILDIIITMKRMNIISKKEAFEISYNYLKEKYNII